ncbi:MAG: sialidase family protein [Planctomycetia bacterium]|nr:sialidase family protein [Planctomycetia bacterium]
MFSRIFFLVLLTGVGGTNVSFSGTPAACAKPESSVPFSAGMDDYSTYRIPSISEAPDGTLLALAEGRRYSASDTGDIDLVLRRSHDGGRTWEPMRVLWDDAGNTCGNPCPVVDSMGTIHLLMTWNRGDDVESRIIAGESHDIRRIFVMRSSDQGETWSEPIEISETTRKSDWTWYATGPGVGIRLENGPHAGRLVIPCDHVERDTKAMRSHVIISDDHGLTWRIGGTAPEPGVNECEVAELPDGSLLLNMRNYDRSEPSRQISRSVDGGLTWIDQRHDAVLIEPICQASFRRVGTEGENAMTYLFSNPASEKKRERMTIRMSTDGAKTWKYSRKIDDRPAAYSCLVALQDGTFGCLYETGDRTAYETITFIRFSESWVRGTEAVRKNTEERDVENGKRDGTVPAPGEYSDR